MSETLIVTVGALALMPIVAGYLMVASSAGTQMTVTTTDVLCQLEAARASAVRQLQENEPLRLELSATPCATETVVSGD